MHRPTTTAEAERLRALHTLDALRLHIESGGAARIEERPPRGVYPTDAGPNYRRLVVFAVDASSYDSSWPLPGR